MAATIKDVAKHADVGIATVSKYLNGGKVLGKNSIRIDEAIVALNYKINSLARSLKTSKTMTVGVLLPSLENIFSTSIVSKIENILQEAGYSTLICDFQEDIILEKKKLVFLGDRQIDGMIYMPLKGCVEGLKQLQGNGIPVVLIDRAIKNCECDTVLIDNLNASYEAVEHLIIMGHRRIGIINGPDTIFTAEERMRGYYRVHEDYRISVDQKLIVCGDYRMDIAYEQAMKMLSAKNSPTALYVTNYEMTLGALMAINDLNLKIPEDLSFIGFDNLALANIFKPPLTIVVQPTSEIVETAARLLLKRMKGNQDGFPELIRMKTRLIKKNTVDKPKTLDS